MRPDYDRAARLAYKTLLALHIDSLPVDPLAILMHCKTAAIHTYDDVLARYESRDYHSFKYFFFDNLDAMTFRHEFGDKTVYEVFFDNRLHVRRRRFTLAHELGHIILKHRMEERWEEQEADYFAGQLLAPHPIVRTVQDIAGVCEISQPAARIAAGPMRHREDPAIVDLLRNQFRCYTANGGDKRVEAIPDGSVPSPVRYACDR